MTELVKRLQVSMEADKNKSASESQAQISYCLRLLASRMYPSVVKDEFQIARTIQKKLAARSEIDSSALQFEELFASLCAKSKQSLKEKWSVLYLLYSLSKSSSDAKITSQVFSLGSQAPKAAVAPLAKTGLASLKAQPQAAQRSGRAGPSSLLKGKASMGEEIAEERLVRDCIFNFQGIDGEYIKFDKARDAFIVSDRVEVCLCEFFLTVVRCLLLSLNQLFALVLDSCRFKSVGPTGG